MTNNKNNTETVDVAEGDSAMDQKFFDLRDKLGVTRLISMVRRGYSLRKYDHDWVRDRCAKDFASDCLRRYHAEIGVVLTEGEWKSFAINFMEWVKNNHKDVELWLAKKSPANAGKLAVTYRTRLHEEAEKIIMDKAKDKAGLLEYCSFFAIVLPDLTNVTLKAAFADGDREKKYIKKLEETKRSLKSFLVQLLNAEQIKSDQTVSELVESL